MGVKGGKLVYSFNCGSGASHLATNFRVDDGKWHSVEFSRVAKHGKLVFDSIEVKVETHNRESQGSTTNLEVRPNIYLGGLEPSIAGSDDLKRDLQMRGSGDIKGFIGCLRNLKYEVSGDEVGEEQQGDPLLGEGGARLLLWQRWRQDQGREEVPSWPRLRHHDDDQTEEPDRYPGRSE